jgi:hypothetical protein
MTSMIDGTAVRQVITGIKVEKASELLPQTATQALFSVAGGRVLITALVGEVTIVVPGVANATKLIFNPTAVGADQDMCATLDITGDAVGELYTISGTVGDAMRSDLLVANPVLQSALCVSEGSIGLNTAGNSVTGDTAWTIVYVPLDDGAYVVSA